MNQLSSEKNGCERNRSWITRYWSLTSVVSNSVWPHRQQPTWLRRPRDSPGKNTGVGCHFLLQCMKVKSESEVVQSCPTLATPWTAAYQAPPSMGFSRQEYWSEVPLHWSLTEMPLKPNPEAWDPDVPHQGALMNLCRLAQCLRDISLQVLGGSYSSIHIFCLIYPYHITLLFQHRTLSQSHFHLKSSEPSICLKWRLLTL